MYTKERIYALRLAEAVKRNPEYGEKIGVSISTKKRSQTENEVKTLRKPGGENETRF